MRGVHYESSLTSTQSNLHLGLRTASLLKGGKEYCKLCPGVRLSLQHIASHAQKEELYDVFDAMDETSSLFGTIDRQRIYHRCILFGFVDAEMYTKKRAPQDAKAFTRHMRKLSAMLGAIGAAWYAKCLTWQRAPDLTPNIEFALATIQAKTLNRYQGFADASLQPDPSGNVRMGLGGHINEGDVVLFDFAIGRTVPAWVSPIDTTCFTNTICSTDTTCSTDITIFTNFTRSSSGSRVTPQTQRASQTQHAPRAQHAPQTQHAG